MDELEQFASRAEAAITVAKQAERRTREKKSLVAPPSLLDESWWTKGRGIALIHADSESLLGNFVEYLHPSGARKLVRETWPIAISAVERVEGSWWLGTERTPEPRQDWHTKRPVIMHLHLELLGVHAPAVEMMVHIYYGGIARCELAQTSLFTTAGNQERSMLPSLIELPAGTNVLEVMGLDAKINLRREVGL